MSNKSIKINNVAILLDASSSMSPHERRVIPELRAQIARLRDDSQTHDVKTFVTVYTFGEVVECRSLLCDVTRVGMFPSYSASQSSTRLIDALDAAITYLSTVPGQDDSDVSFLIIVITDGQENASYNVTPAQIKHNIAKLSAGNWTFAGITPKPDNLVRFGFLHGNILQWAPERGEQEYMRASQVTRVATSNYYEQTSCGVRSLGKFFTDLSGVAVKDLKTEAMEVGVYFKVFPVPCESVIKEFVESRTKRPYFKGEAFYQLTKDELVQGAKEIVIQDKVSGKMYGGTGVRKLLGLPEYGDMKVKIGNHAMYNVFVQSTSVNRKLVRGTCVLVRK